MPPADRGPRRQPFGLVVPFTRGEFVYEGTMPTATASAIHEALEREGLESLFASHLYEGLELAHQARPLVTILALQEHGLTAVDATTVLPSGALASFAAATHLTVVPLADLGEATTLHHHLHTAVSHSAQIHPGPPIEIPWPRTTSRADPAPARPLTSPPPAAPLESSPPFAEDYLSLGSLTLDPNRGILWAAGTPFEMNPMALDLLEVLLHAPGQAQSLEHLASRLHTSDLVAVERILAEVQHEVHRSCPDIRMVHGPEGSALRAE